jgi:hypothetical protein
LGRGKDEKGDYVSYYDKFDQGTGSGLNPGEMLNLTKPFEIYDRIYIDAKTGKPIQSTMKTNQYSKGGTIHINPENKGKFNATKKATGKTTEELTHSNNPVTKKRAIFAQNAAKWKHAEGGEIDPKNSFGLTGNYSRNPNSEAIESNYKLAADYQRRLGNFNTGLNANLGFNQTMPLNTEVPVMTPMIVPNANVGLNVGYDKNNSNFNGSFNYNPINQGINAEVTYRRRFAGGGETENDLIKPMVSESTGVNAPILYKTNVLTNNQRLNLPIGHPLRPSSGPSSIPNMANIPQNDYQKQQLSNLNKPNIISSFLPIMKSGLHTADLPQLKMMKAITGKEEFPSDALRRATNHYGDLPSSMPGSTAINALGYLGDVVLDPLNINPFGGMEAKGLKTAHKVYHTLHHLLDYPVKANKAYHNATGGNDSSAPHHAYGGRVLPKYADAGWLTKNKAGVGAGLGFAGDTTNLLFDNNVFGTHNKVTDSEGNELGEAQSDAGSQTQGALSGALKGASAGAALGPWGMAGGALIGGVAGFLTADTGAQDKLNQVKKERNAQISFKNILGKGPIGNNAIQTNSLALSAYGGYINKKYAEGGMKMLNQDHPEATEEVELGESAMLPNGMNVEFGGETHENGGLETNLPEGTRIFSDRIKSGKRTIASIAKPIQNKIEKLKNNNSKAGQNTVKLFENQLDNLFNEQEEIKQIEDMKQQRKYFAKGGLVKYVEGGNDDIFSNPNKYVNKLPDNSPVRIGNENTISAEYQNRPYQYDKELAIAKKTMPIEKIEPVKKAMINNASKAQSFQPLAADAQAMYEEKRANPAWNNFKGNYSIYSKENSMLSLFDNKHNLISQTRAGRGVGVGDTPNHANPKNWYDSNKPKKGQEEAIKAATTSAGAYVIQEGPVEKDYGTKVYRFDKPNENNVQKAMHGIYKGDMYNRSKIINDPNIKQAFVSNGCLNIPAKFLNKYDNQINTGDSLFITKEPKFAGGGEIEEEDLPYSEKRQYMLDYLKGKNQDWNRIPKEDAVINYAKEKQAEKEQINNELGALLDAENSNTVTPYNQNINTIQPRSISKLNTNQVFNQPNRINTPNFSVQPKVNPVLQPTDYKPGSYGFAKDPVLNLNQPVIKPNYVPANSDQADYEYLKEYLKANPDIMKRGNIQPRPLFTLSPLDVKGTKMISPINNGQPFNLNQIKSDIAAEANLKKTPPTSEPRFNKGDIGMAGALGTSLIGNLIQRSNLNKVAPPRTLVAPTFTAGRTPVNADYSADLQAADNQFNAAKRGVMLNSGNYSTQAGNLGQLRAEQLRNRSKILQNQNNANVALMNEYQKEQADAANKNAASNYATDQANMENLNLYNTWKVGQTNAADASAFNTSGQMFNNMVTGQNQLDVAEMYKRMYDQKIKDDLAFKKEGKAMGGTIKKRTIKKK